MNNIYIYIYILPCTHASHDESRVRAQARLPQVAAPPVRLGSSSSSSSSSSSNSSSVVVVQY